jgi:hypothetical protein
MATATAGGAPPDVRPERFVLATFADGAVLLDLDSGVAFALNATAAFVWERRLGKRDDESVEAVEAALAARFGLAQEQARADVAATLALPATHAFPPPPGDFWYERDGAGYRFSFRGKPVLEIAGDGAGVRALAPLTPAEAALHLLAVSPKLLALRGATVLHAGAVLGDDGRVVAFSGPSGAGKTSAARAFVAAGLGAVSEDKLIVRAGDGGGAPVAMVSGEARIAAWVSRLGAELVAAPPGTFCAAGDLAEAAAARPALPVAEILLVDAARRAGDDITRAPPLGPARTAAALFPQIFYGSDTRDAWQLQLDAIAALARAVPVSLATMPDGLDRLPAAARRYAETTRSNAPPSLGSPA